MLNNDFIASELECVVECYQFSSELQPNSKGNCVMEIYTGRLVSISVIFVPQMELN